MFAGSALALAILVPNIEFIFGLCGSTVSVLISFILPAAIYLRVTALQQGVPGASRVGATGPATGRAARGGGVLVEACGKGAAHALT